MTDVNFLYIEPDTKSSLMPDALTAEFGAKAANLSKINDSATYNIPRALCISKDASLNPEPDKFFAPTSVFMKSVGSELRGLAERAGFSDDSKGPFVFSVRSGAPISMPGMMDTVLNVGLNRNNLGAFMASRNGTPEFAHMAYHRLITGIASSAFGVDKTPFEERIRAAKLFFNGTNLEVDWDSLSDAMDKMLLDETGYVIGSDFNEELSLCMLAVAKSWNSERAKYYREVNGIADDIGTGIMLQQMVFGNANDNSCSGVVLTHNPNTGDHKWYGDFLIKSQGEDVVSGAYTPRPIEEMLLDADIRPIGLKLEKLVKSLHKKTGEILDIEFTVEDGQLYLLQWRKAKTTRKAQIRNILERSGKGALDINEAIDYLLEMFPNTKAVLSDGSFAKITNGLRGVTEGMAQGVVAIGREQAQQYAEVGTPYIFMATETSPDDFEYMLKAEGFVTTHGGAVCHATLVARNFDKVCIPGCSDIEIAEDLQSFSIDGIVYDTGIPMLINGDTGEVCA